jgi:hypothetical protein
MKVKRKKERRKEGRKKKCLDNWPRMNKRAGGSRFEVRV